jgi:hypothetical protein
MELKSYHLGSTIVIIIAGKNLQKMLKVMDKSMRKNKTVDWSQILFPEYWVWFMPVVLATGEVDIRRITVRGQPLYQEISWAWCHMSVIMATWEA